MQNEWLNKKLKRQLFTMPTSLNEDFDLEFEDIRGSQIPKLLEYWTWHLTHGNLTVQEHRAICAIIIYQFETQHAT